MKKYYCVRKTSKNSYC